LLENRIFGLFTLEQWGDHIISKFAIC
jgi:hypothetical protein